MGGVQGPSRAGSPARAAAEAWAGRRASGPLPVALACHPPAHAVRLPEKLHTIPEPQSSGWETEAAEPARLARGGAGPHIPFCPMAAGRLRAPSTRRSWAGLPGA